MPAMSAGEVLACRNPLWRAFTSRVVVPWVFAGCSLEGKVLELGSGAGANAAALLRRYPDAHITATDVDPVMLEAARSRLAPFGSRAVVQAADAGDLPFDDARFDAVVSMIMLHHVGDLAAACTECARVLRPDGSFVGYDLTRVRHGHHSVTPDGLRSALVDAGFDRIRVGTGLGGLVARFSARRPPPPKGPDS